MATRLLFCGPALRRIATPVGISFALGSLMASRQQAVRLDAVPDKTTRTRINGLGRGLEPDVVKQLSTGSVAGFVLGLLVSVFSRTLVLLVGLGIVSIQFASHYLGIDILRRSRLKERLQSSRILSALNRNPMFKLFFGISFALSAFASF